MSLIQKNDLISKYGYHKNLGHSPVILESLGPQTHFSKLSILGFRPTHKLEIWDNKLYLDNKKIHNASPLDIFKYLRFNNSSPGDPRSIFPTWLGFFSYEFARHFGYATHKPFEHMPEAAFYYFETGDISYENNNTTVIPKFATGAAKADIRDLDLKSSFSQANYIQAIKQIQEKIKQGNVYQVNLSRQFKVDLENKNNISPFQLYLNLRQNNPSPFMGLIERPEYAICSGSPERLYDLKNKNMLSARPIAGTRPRGKNKEQDLELEKELKNCPKEIAEHVMLADLLRNDVSMCSEAGSVYMSEAISVEKYAHVMHLVSEIKSQTSHSLNTNLLNVTKSIFPGGTITGAPKTTVMQAIKELEPGPRGPYTGSMGYISNSGQVDFNILIRTPFFTNNSLYFSSGGGIVINSDPEKEFEETIHKAGSFYEALTNKKLGKQPEKPKIFSFWNLNHKDLRNKFENQNKKILFIENQDSFSYNIINYLKILGAQVEINKKPNSSYSHIIIGPGPGSPKDYHYFENIINFAKINKKPLLGICLGHQAIGQYFGASLAKTDEPVHGEAHQIYQIKKSKLFDETPNNSKFTRYHSLCLENIKQPLIQVATTNAANINMAIEHESLPIFGIQFHPESFISEHGLKILENFLN